MRSKTLIVVLALLALAGVMLGACQPVQPATATASPRGVDGEIYLPGVPAWGGISIAMQFDVAEANPATHEATGFVNWRVFQPQPPEGEAFWKVVNSQVRYVFFGADIVGADPNTVVVIAEITSKQGWGQGVPGEYGYFWWRDGGNAGPDQWGMRYYTLDPWYEFFPVGKPPVDAGYFTVAEMQADDPVLPLDVEAGEITIQSGGVVHEVLPTGNPALDIANVQAAIDGAKDGDTILLKAGTFNFGDWKTNPIPGGFVLITKGVTVTGDGLDADGNPKTIIHGGGYRMKNHGDTGEYGVITFGGDGQGGVLDGVWLQEPHFYGVFISGFVGQNHENITVRNVKVTDISADIPDWDRTTAIGRSIDMGGNVPDFDVKGPTGTITIEHCNISNTGSALDLTYLDPETGTVYYADPEGKPFPADGQQGTHAIGLWINMSSNFVVRNNTLQSQHEGLVMEYMSGSGDILIADNDIAVEAGALPPKLLRGIRVTTTDATEFPFASTRTVRIENNRIRVVGSGEAETPVVGMLLSNDNGVPGFGATYVVTGNEVEMENGNAAFALGSSIPVATLKDAVISNNRISGTAEYGVLSLDGAQNCTIADNDMSAFTPSVAHIGLNGAGTHDNQVTGTDGVYVEADGAHDNTVTGYTAK